MAEVTRWASVPLTEVLDFREGPGILAKDFHESGVPLIRLAGVKRGANILDGCNFLDPTLVEKKWSQFRLRRGDVLLSTSASLGEVAVVEDEGVGAVPYTGLIGFRPRDDRVSPRFIPIALTSRSFKAQIEAMGVGSVMKHFGPMHLRQMSVEVPPLGVQEGIADVVEALDDKIAANTKLATTADELVLALAAGLTPSVPLREVAEFKRRSVDPTNVESSLVAHYSLPAFDATSRPEMAEPATIKSGKFLLDAPSVLVSKLNPRFPRVWNVPELPEVPALASTEFVVLRPNFSSSTVLWSLVAQQRFGSALEGMVAGTSGSHQRVKPVDMLEVLVPDPRAMSADLVARIEAVAASARSARDALPLLEATRDALLPALMSGRLRVEDAAEMTA